MTNKLIAKVNYDKERQHLSIDVYTDYLNMLKDILSNPKPIGKAFKNITKVYVLLSWMNSVKQYHIDKEDLATMTYARNKERLNKAINILIDNQLLETQLHQNQSKSRSYYTYKVHVLKYERKTNATTTFEFDIPIVTYCNLLVAENKQNGNIIFPSSSPHIYRNDSLSGGKNNGFQQKFLGWYEELDFGETVVPRGRFSLKDGRFYHRFNTMPKDERLSSVTWDGDNLKEVWDAHSAFFIVLGYYLKFVVSYQSEEDAIIVKNEADEMLNLAISDQFYSSIMKYHNKHASWFINRNKAKEMTQKYVNKTYSRFFKKNGERCKHPDSIELQYVDEFFQNNYPCIRNWLLNYPRHENYKQIEINRENKKFTQIKKVSVSNIHMDIMPYEFELISMGLCKDLYNIYGVKSVTVHDAIYLKSRDAAIITPDIIDSCLAFRLGLKTNAEIIRTRKLF